MTYLTHNPKRAIWANNKLLTWNQLLLTFFANQFAPRKLRNRSIANRREGKNVPDPRKSFPFLTSFNGPAWSLRSDFVFSERWNDGIIGDPRRIHFISCIINNFSSHQQFEGFSLPALDSRSIIFSFFVHFRWRRNASRQKTERPVSASSTFEHR